VSTIPAEEGRAALANVLGALALVLTDEMGRHVAVAAGAGSVTDAATLSALAQFLDGANLDRVHQVLGVTPSGAVRLVDRLQAAGLVERTRGTDRRSRAVRLTDEGRARARAVGGARATYLLEVLGAVTTGEVDMLRTLLGKVMAGAVRHKDGGAWTCRLCDLVACRRSEGECPAYTAAQERFRLPDGRDRPAD
jgi:DNA-binding MarR family transcriptional regulator